MWTENYSGWFLSFGYPVPFRPVEDLAFAVARFFETGGTFQNYYMYYGGTNFGRTAGGPLIATSYDYDAPLDEYGFIRQPKWGHLRDLHIAIKQCEEYLVNSDPVQMSLGVNLEAHLYYKSTNNCAAFLANYGNSLDANVTFKGKSYFLPAWSVSILPDCKNVIFNTANVVSQKDLDDVTLGHNKYITEFTFASSTWAWYNEKIGVWGNNSFVAPRLLEQINTTKDSSDNLWYTTSINVDEKIENGQAKDVFLLIQSLGHAALVFVNKKLVGFGYGNHDDASFKLSEKISLNQGNNTLDILSIMVGLQNYGPWFDIAGAGIYSVFLSDLKDSKEDLSSTEWSYQVGVEGECLGLNKLNLASSSLWIQGSTIPTNQSLMWYKATFLAPEGKNSLSLNLTSMGKGQAWVNGQSIGRYWPAYHSPSTGCSESCDYRGNYDSSKCLKNCGEPTQTLYNVPRSWLRAGENLLVLHEELGGDPTKIFLIEKNGQEICARVSEADPPPADTWQPNSDFASRVPEVRLNCEKGWSITSIHLASFGTPQGDCATFAPGNCHADVISTVQRVCLGKQECRIPVSTAKLGDPCPGVLKTLAVQALCSA